MTGLVQTILRRAESVGIRLRLEGSKLKAALPDSKDPRILEVVDQLRHHRDEIRDLLNRVDPYTRREKQEIPPVDSCYACGGMLYWRRPTGGYVCEKCHPDPWRNLASERIQ